MGAQRGEYRLLPIELIRPGRYQPRTEFDPAGLQELAESIRSQGVIQPIIARPDSLTRVGYEIMAGERRWRAAQIAGCDTIPAIIRETDDLKAAVQAIIENLQREDLDAIDEARGMRRLVDEFKLSHGEVANYVGITRSAVSHRLRLLRLPGPLQQALKAGAIETGHARLLVALEPARQRAMFDKIVKKRWTVRQLEAALRDSSVHRLEEHLARHLGAPVKVVWTQMRRVT